MHMPATDSSATITLSSSTQTGICVAMGDGIGPEIMSSVLRILTESGAQLDPTTIRLGKSVYDEGVLSGVEPGAWDAIREQGIILKAPITTPQGGGVKSLNVTLRKTLGLYANVRPCRSYDPFVPTHFPNLDLLIVRENEEDTYAGIEHRQTEEVTQCLKLITRPGCERIVRHAFETTRQQGRSRITCMTKDNIMKVTDGLFHSVFDEIAGEYPDIEIEHMIIDIGAAKLANDPERFDVILAPNLYGDILSDIAAEVAGSVGLAGSANLGRHASMFEAIHGSAPDIAGQDLANPSALLRAAVQMLVHIGQGEVASRIENAWLKTLEDGVHTADIASEQTRQRVGTQAFTQAVIDRLGQTPDHFPAVAYDNQPATVMEKEDTPAYSVLPTRKELAGIDIFLDWVGHGRTPDMLGPALQDACPLPLKLKMITNRGVKVFPDGQPETFCTDHWRCRFVPAPEQSLEPRDLVLLQHSLLTRGFDIIKTENLYWFDGEIGYSLGQGE